MWLDRYIDKQTDSLNLPYQAEKGFYINVAFSYFHLFTSSPLFISLQLNPFSYLIRVLIMSLTLHLPAPRRGH